MRLLLILALLILSACATLTGDPVADCLAARNQALQAQGFATAAAAIAAADPDNTHLAAAAGAAQANLASSQALVVALCIPAPAI